MKTLKTMVVREDIHLKRMTCEDIQLKTMDYKDIVSFVVPFLIS